MKIIIPVDFSEDSNRALEFIMGLRAGKKTDFLLVHIIEMVYDFAAQASIALSTMHKDADSMMNKMIEKYSSDGVHFKKIIKEGTASVTIARLAEEKKGDLIVMGTKGASGVKKVLMGTTTANLINESRLPVLIVPEKANLASLKDLTLALEFSQHEKPLIQKVLSISKEWGLNLNYIHVQNAPNFKDELAVLGLRVFVKQTLEEKKAKVYSVQADSLSEGLDSFLKKNEETILVMCHQHKNFWKQIIEGSHTISMAYHIHTPLLVMN